MPWNAYFKIAYNAKGGNPTPSSQDFSNNNIPDSTTSVPHTFKVSSTKPTLTGYVFKSWGGHAAGSSITLTCQQSAGSVVQTLAAVYTKRTYTVSFNANGGTNAPAAQTKTYGTALTLTSAVPTWSGHTFIGWNTAANGSGTDYASGGQYTANAAVTLYAVWVVSSYSIKYYPNGGVGDPIVDTKTFNVGIIIRFASTYSRVGYSFVGWNTKADGSGTTYVGGDAYTTNASLTLYARWSADYITVSYDANGGSGAPASQSKAVTGQITLRPTVPTKTGYNFTGWKYGSATYQAGDVFSGTTLSNLTLVAQWSAKTTTLSFAPNGGETTPSSKTITYGQAYGALPTISRRFYSFNGWFTAATGGTQVTAATVSTATSPQTVYAQWTQIAVPYDPVRVGTYVKKSGVCKRVDVGEVQADKSIQYGDAYWMKWRIR